MFLEIQEDYYNYFFELAENYCSTPAKRGVIFNEANFCMMMPNGFGSTNYPTAKFPFHSQNNSLLF